MPINVDLKLYSILREKLPAEARGYARLALDDDASLGDILGKLDIPCRAVVSVNGEHETDLDRALCDGDDVRIFSSTSGG